MTQADASLDLPGAIVQGVAASMQAHVGLYAAIARDVVGRALRSLTLSGAVLDATFDPRRGAAESVLVVETLDLVMIRRLADQGARLGKLGLAAPLVFTGEHIRTSLDTFPLEFIEIAQRHLTIVGEDPFNSLCFKDDDVRLQCEREIKRALIGLRQGLLATAGRERLIPSLEREAASALVRTLRGVLWLRGQKDYAPTGDVIAHVETAAGRRLNGLRSAVDHAVTPGWHEFETLYQDVEAVGELIHV